MRSSWKGLYISSDIFFKIIKTKNKKKLNRRRSKNDFKVFLKETRGIRNSTIIPEMKFFTFELPYGVVGHVKVKVRKKGKKMIRYKAPKELRLLNNSLLGFKLGEFAPTRNFFKHTKKKK